MLLNDFGMLAGGVWGWKRGGTAGHPRVGRLRVRVVVRGQWVVVGS